MLGRIVSLCTLCGALGAAGWLLAQEAPKSDPKAAPAAKPAAPETEADSFTPPEGNDEQAISMFLQRMLRTPPSEPTPEGIVKHLNKVDQAVTQLLARDLSDDLYTTIAQLRLQLFSALPEFGDKTAAARKQAFLKELEGSKREAVQKLVKRFAFEERVDQVVKADAKGQQALIQEIAGMIKGAPKGDDEALGFAVEMAMNAARQLERGESDQAAAAYRSFADAVKGRQEERLNDLLRTLEGTARRLELPGKAMEVAGTTVEGQPFDIKQYKDKVVLVDFWATWCGPCRAELPHVKELYEAYHEKGFEVVGISLDNDKAALERFLDNEDIEWVTLWDDKAENGWDNKIAAYYGVSGIPMTVLINKQGKVVTTGARGLELSAELEKLLGPIAPAQPEKSPAPPKK